MSKKIYLSPSNQPLNIYCLGNTNEKAQMEILAGKIKAILDKEYVCETVMATLSMGIGLTERPTEAKNKGCEVYIAIHSNAGGSNASGAVGIYHPSQAIGKTLAGNIVAELNANCPIKSNRLEPVINGMLAFNGAGYGEIRSPEHLGLIAILIETNFHDNPKTCQYILDSKDIIARAYVNGIVKTFNIIRKFIPALPVVVQPFPGVQFFGKGKANNYILMLGQQLVKKGYGKHYKVGPSKTWGEADRLNVQAFQLSQGWTGSGADGLPGPLTWQKLFK